MAQNPTPPELDAFLSYAHHDLHLVKALHKLLGPRLAIGKIRRLRIWNDEEILAGEPWRHEIEAAMERSDLALLAISPNFLNSDFITNIELPTLLGRADKVVVPFMVDDVSFEHHRLLGVEALQIFQFPAPEPTERRSFRRMATNRRADWVNLLVEHIHGRYARRDGAAA